MNVRCVGTPLRCDQITSEASCNRALNCNFVPGPAPVIPPIPAPDVPTENIEGELGPGTCFGTVIGSCANLFSTTTYDACFGPPAADVARCGASCTHPGCACVDQPGRCLVSSGVIRFVTGPRGSTLGSLRENHRLSRHLTCLCFAFQMLR